jgi:hypothetical protein
VFWILALLIPAVICVGLAEGLASFVSLRHRALFKKDFNPHQLSATEGHHFFVSDNHAPDQLGFDPDLGWDRVPPIRTYDPDVHYDAQAFGDSLTFCPGVADSETWASYLGELTGIQTLNFGVGGYGLDQAVLKAEKYSSRFSTKISILGLYSEEYRRSHSYYGCYYFRSHPSFQYAFKPIFIEGGGSYELIKPPCSNVNCLIDMVTEGNTNLKEFLNKHDYWYRDNLRRPSLRAPYLPGLVRVVPELLTLRSRGRRWFVTPDSVHLAEFLIDRFADICHRAGSQPVYVLIYNAKQLARIRSGMDKDQAIREHLKKHHLPYINTSDYILESCPTAADLENVRGLSGHLSPYGNRLVAEAIAGSQALALLNRPGSGAG